MGSIQQHSRIPYSTGQIMKAVVAHPGAQHSHRLVLALQKAGYLEAFVTSLYMDWHHAPFSYLSFMPRGFRNRVEQQVFERFRRQLAGIDPDRVMVIGPTLELMLTLTRRAGLPPQWYKRASQGLSLRFQRELVKEWGARTDVLVCYDTNAFEAFRQARSKNAMVLVLDQSIAHPASREQILQEERYLDPEFAETTLLPSEISPLYPRWLEETQLADWILVGCSFAKQTCLEQGVSSEKVFVVPYGVDTDFFSPASRPNATQGLRVLFVGSVGQRKGIRYLLDGFASAALPDSQLFFCGTMEGDANAFRKYSDWFEYLGPKPHAQMRRVYQSTDVLVLPSLLEGFGLVILEAMACGIPVIASTNTGGTDVIQDGVDGFIVPVRSAEAIQEKLEILYRDPERRLAMGRAARCKAERYTWARYERQIEEVFSLIGQRRGLNS
jgi:glycosyltransferase involved in cell wall biosynthesis